MVESIDKQSAFKLKYCIAITVFPHQKEESLTPKTKFSKHTANVLKLNFKHVIDKYGLN